jgi:pantoate--beta-alanine ligase
MKQGEIKVETIRTIRELRRKLAPHRQSGRSIGFMPTLGYMHEGHLSLIRRARKENDIAVISIFVNPLQFGPNEDFDRYPRDMERDLRLAQEAGVDFAFVPDVREMYPEPVKTTVKVSGITDRLCGASRPGHFEGVATVVLKLLLIVGPDRAYFGMKDAQQVAVIEQMVKDLNVPVAIVPCPTLRESDGLAMSSRNVYLSPEERRQAVVLNQALQEAAAAAAAGRTDAGYLRSLVAGRIAAAPLADPEYVEVLSYPSLEPLEGRAQPGTRIIIAVAVRFGKTRLIDNTILEIR